MKILSREEQSVYDAYRGKIVEVEEVSEFKHIERLIQKDEELINYGLVDNLLIKLAKHRTHMLDRIDEAVENY